MTELQKKYVQMEKQKAKIKEFYEKFDALTEELFDELGEGGHFQDDEGTVYQAVNQTGTFVSFKTKGIDRTRREGEKKGSLSLKSAEALGYEVK